MKCLAVLCAVALLAGCAVPEPQAPANPLPESWLLPLPAVQPAATDPAWWHAYGDGRLNALVTRALAANRSLHVAILNIENADAVLRETGANLLPEIDGTGKASRSGRGGNTTSKTHSLAGSLSYTLDFWGKIRAQRQAALENLKATEFSAAVTRQTVISSVCSAYISALSATAQLKHQRNTLASRTRIVEITQARLARGDSTRLAVEQARAQQASCRATIASLELQLAKLENTIGILIADPAWKMPALPDNLLPVPPAVAPGLPSSLLARRPDIRSAQALLARRHALVHVARTAFLPSISLTGSLGYSSSALNALFDKSVWSAGAVIDLPIFDAGERIARYDEATVEQRIALENYWTSAQSAFTEVRNALSAIAQDERIEKARAEELAAARRADSIARAAWKEGARSFTDVLTTQVSLNSAAVSWIQARASRLADYATLCTALGEGAQVPQFAPGAKN